MISLAVVVSSIIATAACPDTTSRSTPDSLRLQAFRADSAPQFGDLTRYWERFRVDSADLARLLATFEVVPEHEWHHYYSHVGGGDRTGWARLANGRELHWMVRPGGLMRLQYADGTQVYLVSCRTTF
jgi:hypothetical protein